MVYDIFEVSFDDLSLDDVRAFLTEAEEEGVNWEAKAERPKDAPADSPGRLRPQHVQSSVCGFANQLGGYLLIGASRNEGTWDLPGVRPPRDEPELWLDQVIGELRPVPRYRRKAWTLEDSQVAAVVAVEPLGQTPCMTRDGQIFERVSSETRLVTDPVRLAELFARGERARAEAQARAERATLEVLDHPDAVAGHSACIAVSMAAASYKPDIGGRLFHDRFNKQARELVAKRLFEEGGLSWQPQVVRPAVRQSYIEFGAGSENLYWVTRTSWDGAAAVVAGLAGEVIDRLSLFDYIVCRAWNLASDLVSEVGGYGDSRIQMSVRVVQPEHDEMTMGELFERQRSGIGPPPAPNTIYAKLPEKTDIRRWSEVREATSDEIGSVQREFERAAGSGDSRASPNRPASRPLLGLEAAQGA